MGNIYGLIGEKLGHSFSPRIHSLICEALNIKGSYFLFELEKRDLKDAILGGKALKIKGFNVTIPYKIEMMQHMDEMEEAAKKIGSINTVVFKDGKSIGYNTDYHGFGMMLKKQDVDLKNKKCVILGTGGASKAVLQYLLDNHAKEILFVSRDKEKSKERYKEFECIDYQDLKSIKEKDILINCTPCGMYPNTQESPIDTMDLKNFKVAVDLIYNPIQTLFIKESKEKGLKGLNGLYMLIGQAIKSQELWNDLKIEDQIVDKIYEKLICEIDH